MIFSRDIAPLAGRGGGLYRTGSTDEATTRLQPLELRSDSLPSFVVSASSDRVGRK